MTDTEWENPLLSQLWERHTVRFGIGSSITHQGLRQCAERLDLLVGPRKDIPVAQGTVPLQLPPVRFIHFKDKNGHCARLIASHCVLPTSPLGPCMYVSAASAWVLSPLTQPLSHGLSSLLTNPHAVDILSKERPLESQSQTCPEMSHADVSYLPSSTIRAKPALPALPRTSPRLTSPAQESPSSLHSPRPSQPLEPHLVHEAGPAAAVFCFPALWTPRPSCVTRSVPCAVHGCMRASCSCLACLGGQDWQILPVSHTRT